MLEQFQEHDAEFQLLSWPPNSQDLNPIRHIWNVMKLHFISEFKYHQVTKSRVCMTFI